MITYQLEPFLKIKNEAFKLAKKHYKEVDSEKDTIKLDPNFEVYEQLDRLGGLIIISARDNEKLIGYSFFITNYSLHCKSIVLAVNDLFYVEPDYRRNHIGTFLLEKSEKELKQRGINQIIMSTKTYASFAPLLEKNGYEAIEITYKKNINIPE